MSEPFWFYDWMDEMGIQNDDDAERAIRSKIGLSRLRASAEAAQPGSFPGPPVPSDQATVLAGRAVDLSALVGCAKLGCQKAGIDNLFRSVWHSFDRVIVEGPGAIRIMDLLKNEDQEAREYAVKTIASYAETLRYVQRIGGEDLLTFRQKPIPCAHHWDRHLGEAGLVDIAVDADQIVADLMRRGTLNSLDKASDGTWSFDFDHPLLGSPIFGNIIEEEGSVDPEKSPLRAVAETVFKHYAGWLVSDVLFARALEIPVGHSFHGHASQVNPLNTESRASAIAMQISLPFLRDIPIPELLRVREEQHESFERFRKALSDAIREKARADKGPTPLVAAREIERDLIRPAISDIDQRIKAAKGRLNKKSLINMGVGVLAMSIGHLANMPFLLPVGVAAALSPGVSHYPKYVEEKADINLSEMYYLWSLENRAWEFEAPDA